MPIWKRGDPLDLPLLRLTANSYWSVRHALMHKLVLGTTGSGKSSATMKHSILAVAKAGFGLLFCTAKPEDVAFIRKLCAQAGRGHSVIEITEAQGAFNFLAWAMARTGNINDSIDLLDHAIEIVRSSGAAPGGTGDEFWSAAKTAMLRATIPVIWAATGSVRIDDVIAFVRSAPTSSEQMKNPDWQKSSAFFRFFHMAVQKLERMRIPGFDDAAAERALDYWREMAALDAKTSGNIRITLTTALSRFQTGFLKRMFCGDTDTVPELLFHSAILLLNIPVQVYGEDGAIAQKIWKFCVQKACLTRHALDKRQARTPVAIIADEAQNFLYRDPEFMAQCRSALVSVIFATQSIPTIRAKIGGDNARDRAEHLISGFNTVVLHSSACPETNDWFARKIGKSLQRRANFSQNEATSSNFGISMGDQTNWGTSSSSGGSSSHGQGGGSSGSNWNSGSSRGGGDNWGRNRGTGSSYGQSWGENEVLDFTIEPGAFGRVLKTGGPQFAHRVSCFYYQAGRIFPASGSNVVLVEYRQ